MRGAAVLIADDLRLFLEIEKSFLVRAGFEVLTAENGERAVELARQRRPTLILLDQHMPGMDGAAACAAMRREPSLAFTPIIIMSASSFPEIQERCLEAGCTEFVVPKNHQTVRPKGKVTRANQNTEGAYEAGIHFVEVSLRDQELILDYVTG